MVEKYFRNQFFTFLVDLIELSKFEEMIHSKSDNQSCRTKALIIEMF